MTSTGVVTVVSAVIAGGGVVSAALISGSRLLRQEDRRRRAEREQWRTDKRLEAYTALLRAASVVVNRWWDVMDMLRHYDASDPDRIVAAHGHVLAAWDDYTASLAVVRMQGPSRVIKVPADNLRVWMKVFDEEASDLYRMKSNPKSRNYDEFDRKMRKFRDMLEPFEQAAQEVLDAHR